MSLNPTQGGNTHNWNYTKPEEDGFSLKLLGTVAAIQQVQAMNFGADGRPSTPKFWPNSNEPVWNIRMVLVGPKGGYRSWTFQPASKAAKEGKVKSVHIDLFNLAGGKQMTDLLGKTIEVETEAPPAGFNYGRGNPRPWKVRLVDDQGPFQPSEPIDPQFFIPQLLANSAVSGGVMNVPSAAASGDPIDPGAPSVPEDDQPF